MRSCFFTDLGLLGVPEADRFMHGAQVLRHRDTIPDILVFLSHPRTVALGSRDSRAAHPQDLLVPAERLAAEGIALTRSIRGGGVTYHWPGQVACYPVILLGPRERNIPQLMHKLEEVAIRTLAVFGIQAGRRRDAAAFVGLWVDGCKVVSMGVRISNWVTSFGFMINVGGSHAESAYVRPCGLEGVTLVTMEKLLGSASPRSAVIDEVKEHFAAVFGRSLRSMPDSLLEQIRSTEQPGEGE